MMDDAFEILRELEATPADTLGAKADASPAVPRPPTARSPAEPQDERNRLIHLNATAGVTRQELLRQSVELVGVARDGGIIVVGWVDDAECPLDCIKLTAAGWRIALDAARLVRVRRTDVETALGAPPYAYGFFGLVAAPALAYAGEKVKVSLRLSNGGEVSVLQDAKIFSAEMLRDVLLAYLHTASFMGNHQIEAAAALDRGIGAQIVALNTTITARITAARHLERFGAARRQPRASIIVCLYGKPEFLFVQNALFAGRPGIEDYEFIFVSNSPEMSEALLDDARAAARIYGMRQTIVLLPGNAGFGAANNAGVAAALGRRILNINPDVFPRQIDWAARHTALVDALPPEQTRLFGTTLYYDDGSLMHGGMYFEMDSGVTISGKRIEQRHLARVEHYGKGAPDWATTYAQARPVPALTGAFMSTDRAWYETLGGFTEDYIFGHYEDADLCLKSLAGGTPAWLHDIRLWHLEGKGSTRKPHHEGGSLVNRWLFTRKWGGAIGAGVTGPTPTHKLLQRPELAPEPPRRRGRQAGPAA